MAQLPPVADAHFHLWDIERHDYPWLAPAEPEGPFGKTADIRRTYLLDEYLADSANQEVRRAVHVEAGWNPSDPLGEMRWIQGIADARGFPHAHVAHVDLAAGNAAQLIEEHSRFALFRGVRDRLQSGDFTASSAAHTRIDDPQWLLGMQVLDDLGLVFDLQAPASLAKKAASMAGRFPRVRFVMTHAGYPPAPNGPDFAGWLDGISILSEVPNISIMLSGLALGTKKWIPSHGHTIAKALLHRFGSSRVLVASNFPVDRLFATFDDLFGCYRSWLRGLSEVDQGKVLHDNACRIYGLEP